MFHYRKLSILFICLELIIISCFQLIPHRTKQIFNYQNEIQLLEIIETPHSFVHRIEATISIESIWNVNDAAQILFFLIDDFRFSTKSKVSKNNEFTQSLSSHHRHFRKQEFYAALENDMITKLLIKRSNDTSLINFQKGIASLFQFHYSDGVTIEYDALGHCSVLYQSQSSTKYKKIKKECTNWYLKLHSREEKPLGVNVISSQEIDYSLNENQNLNELQSIEKHFINLAAKTDVGNNVKSVMKLTHLSSLTESEQFDASSFEDAISNIKGYEEVEIESEIDGSVNIAKGRLKLLVKSVHTDLKDNKIGTKEMAAAILKLVPIAKITNKKEFVQILKARSTQDIRNALLDLLAITQTDDAHQAVMEVLHIDNVHHFDQLERYFQSLSIGTRPHLSIIQDLYKQMVDKSAIDNVRLHDTILQTLAANCEKFSKKTVRGYDEPTVKRVKELILSKLKFCKTTECSGIYIRSLQNLRDPSTIPYLIDIALNDKILNSVSAMKALKAFSVQHFDDKILHSFEIIFYQISKKYDSTARTLALDMILEMRLTKKQLIDLIMYLMSYDKEFEVKTYVIQRIMMNSEKCSRFSALLHDILRERPELNSYHIKAQKGLTTTFFRTLSSYPLFNETLYSFQESYKGVLKQGTVDIMIEADREQASLFKLGLFTRGLSSFVADSFSNTAEKNEEEPENFLAGMEIGVQGVQLRPLIFFSTQGELMGHVWSGTASDPTPAYQATSLLQDHEEYLILQNGITVYFRIFGAQSIDLNGQITFSIWNRNAHTEINRNTGIAIDGSVSLISFFIKEQNKFLILYEPKINLIADCDFYSDIMMCLQLNKPETIMNYQTMKRRTTVGTNSSVITNLVSFEYKLSGNSLALNRQNNQMCKKLFL